MTWTAVGSFLQAALNPGPGTISLNNQGVGNLILLETLVDSTSNWVNSITGGGANWSAIGTKFTGSTNARISTLWQGTVTATGSQTATMNITGGAPDIRAMGLEFHSTVGSWALDVQGNLDSAGTNTYPSITPAGAGELAFGASIDTGSAVAGSTTGYTYHSTAQGNGALWNVSCTSAAQAPVWGDSGHVFGSFILVKETGGASHNATGALTVTPAGANTLTHGHNATAALTVTPGRTSVRLHAAVRGPALAVTPAMSAARLHAATTGASLVIRPSFGAATSGGRKRGGNTPDRARWWK